MSGNGNSGRPKADIDLEAALDLLTRGGIPAKTIAAELGVSEPTLRARIADIQKRQGVLLQYRAIQSLQLTELQARVLEAITPEKIETAPLKDLILAFKILKEKEFFIEGKSVGEVKGLVAHLIYIEKQEQALREGLPAPEEDTFDAEFTDEAGEEQEEAPSPEMLTTLAELDKDRF